MKAVVFTLGCKVNSCESASLINGLEKLGYDVSDSLEFADLYIINTCAVTAEAEKKSRQAIQRARKYNKDADIIITGCASEKSPQDFLKRENVTLVTGAKAKEKILNSLEEKGIRIEKEDYYLDESIPPTSKRTREYVKIQDGCNNFCSYCIIPYLRGRSRSRSCESIITEINYLQSLEIVLTGINLSSYSYKDINLSELLKKLKGVKCRLRLGSLEERIIDEDFLNSCKNLYNFAPHFHLYLQSGSDKVLKEMNRKYTIVEYRKKCELIRKIFPNAGITTDIIVGYPTETDEDFEKSYSFAKEIEFSDIHCFNYSRREGTQSAKIEEINSDIKKYRLEKMLLLKSELKNKFYNKNLNQIFDFIPESYEYGYTNGYTGNYIKTYIPGQLENKTYKVRLISMKEDGMMGEIIKEK